MTSLVVILLTSGSGASAQTNPPTVRGHRVTEPIHVDGKLDEPIYDACQKRKNSGDCNKLRKAQKAGEDTLNDTREQNIKTLALLVKDVVVRVQLLHPVQPQLLAPREEAVAEEAVQLLTRSFSAAMAGVLLSPEPPMYAPAPRSRSKPKRRPSTLTSASWTAAHG